MQDPTKFSSLTPELVKDLPLTLPIGLGLDEDLLQSESPVTGQEAILPHFVHLRCHSEYSIVDGIVRIDDYINAASLDAMPAVAITDLSNLFGAIKFYKAAREKGIKPIIGCDLWLENTKNRDQAHRLLLLVQNNTGYLQLCA